MPRLAVQERRERRRAGRKRKRVRAEAEAEAGQQRGQGQGQGGGAREKEEEKGQDGRRMTASRKRRERQRRKMQRERALTDAEAAHARGLQQAKEANEEEEGEEEEEDDIDEDEEEENEGPEDYDPMIAAEEAELRYLERQLGIAGKDKTRATQLLGEEFAKYEGLDSDFGSFLADLDTLSAKIKKEKKRGPAERSRKRQRKQSSVAEAKEENDNEGYRVLSRADLDDQFGFSSDEENEDADPMSQNLRYVLDDDEQEPEDIPLPQTGDNDDDKDDEDEDEDEEEEADEDDDDEEEEDDEDEESEEDNSDHNEDEEAEDEEEEEAGDDDEADAEENDTPANFYRPTRGEDIYGRSGSADAKDEDENKQEADEADDDDGDGDDGQGRGEGSRRKPAPVDRTRPEFVARKRRIVRWLNRLSEQSLDAAVRDLLELFRSGGSVGISNVALQACLLEDLLAGAGSRNVLKNLVPLFAALIAAMHITTGVTVTGPLLEATVSHLRKAAGWTNVTELCTRAAAKPAAANRSPAATLHLIRHILHGFADEEDDDGGAAASSSSSYSSSTSSGEAVAAPPAALNMVMFLAYLYNFRAVHSDLIVGLGHEVALRIGSEEHAASRDADVELLMMLLQQCGFQLRADEPDALRRLIVDIQQTVKAAASRGSHARLQFMLDTIADLKSNRRRKADEAVMEHVRRLRKWLGRVKSDLLKSSSSAIVHPVLRVGWEDVVEASRRGRWWQAGAAWTGREQDRNGTGPSSADDRTKRDGALSNDDSHDRLRAISNKERERLEQLAVAQHMNTDTRRAIFMALMTSQDVEDAFESLVKLNLRGQQDRELIRVLMRCCAQEKQYNPFYAHVIDRLCEHNAQSKITLRYGFWDTFRQLESYPKRKAANLARLLAHCVLTFSLSLSILKIIELTSVQETTVLFFSTFFSALFSLDNDEEVVHAVLDRIGHSKDHRDVREFVTWFLRTHFLGSLSQDLPRSQRSALKKRAKGAIKTMDEMSVFDTIAGEDELDVAAGPRTARTRANAGSDEEDDEQR